MSRLWRLTVDFEMAVFLSPSQLIKWDAWWSDKCGHKIGDVEGNCQRYERNKCNPDLGAPKDIGDRRTELKKGFAGVDGASNPYTNAEAQKPDWCCAFQQKKSNFSPKCLADWPYWPDKCAKEG